MITIKQGLHYWVRAASLLVTSSIFATVYLADLKGEDRKEGANTQVPAKSIPQAPDVLPGNGLAEHDFFYARDKDERMFIVRKGRIVWSYTHSGRGEISDAVLRPNGNVLFAHQYAITEITSDKKVVWALRSWTPPEDLGPSTTIQILDGTTAP
jgi:hypothetical protein